jgi:hypothetical protein
MIEPAVADIDISLFRASSGNSAFLKRWYWRRGGLQRVSLATRTADPGRAVPPLMELKGALRLFRRTVGETPMNQP